MRHCQPRNLHIFQALVLSRGPVFSLGVLPGSSGARAPQFHHALVFPIDIEVRCTEYFLNRLARLGTRQLDGVLVGEQSSAKRSMVQD